MAAETKDKSIMVNIEPTFYEMLQILTEKEDISVSAYCRQLIIKDLRDRGLLTDNMMIKVLVG